MGTYDYEKLKELYGADEYSKDTSGIKTNSPQATVDIFDSQFSELDEIITDDSLNTPLTFVAKEELPPVEPFKLEPIALDEPEKIEPVVQVPNMDETLKIETLSLDDISPKVMQAIDDKYEGVKEKPKKQSFLTRLFPWTTVEDHHLEYAFVNCAVLGFITAGMGSGMLLYILNHI